MNFSNQLILKDFDTFIDYINERNSLVLTGEKEVMKSKDVFLLNQKMESFQTKFTSEKNHQNIFVLLNSFFFIAEKAHIIFKKTDVKKGESTLHLNIERASLYDALNDNEKYFFLLDCFWTYIDWDSAYDCRNFYGSEFYLKLVSDFPLGQKILVADRELKREGDVSFRSYTFIAEILNAFGCLELEWDTTIEKRSSKYDFPYRSITITPLGKELIPVLFSDYGMELNYRDTLFRWEGSREIEEDEIDDPNILSEVFKLAFANWDIENKLLPIEYEMQEGVYHFKASLDKKCYRIIEIGANDTFDDLHNAIQEAFDFDNDHLYAFFMDNKRWSRDNDSIYWGPYCEGGKHYAEEMHIGKVGLTVGKQFLYLFDFGDNWRFNMVVADIISDAKEPIEAKVIKSVGEAPEQYEPWEEL